MKKIFLSKKAAVLAIALAAGGIASAEVSFGASVIGGGDVGSVRAGDYEETFGETDSIINLTVGFTLDAQLNFNIGSQSFFVRPSVDFLFNNGLGNGFKFTYDDHTIGTSSKSDCKISVTTIDIPVIFGYTAKFSDKVKMNFFLGPYISFAADGTVEFNGKKHNADFVEPVFGGLAGLEGCLKAGPGSVVLGAGYKFDFAATEMEVNGTKGTLYARRNIFMNAGYRFEL